MLSEKISILQKEIDVEFKIQDGLTRIVKAKGLVKPRKKDQSTDPDLDVFHQLEKSERRLEAFKHEIQKRRVQLQSVLLDSPKSSRVLLATDGGLLRVLVEDPVTQIQAKKVVYIANNQSTLEVIGIILDKSNLKGKPTEYQLCYMGCDRGTLY